MQILLQLFACVFKLVFGMHTLERPPDPPNMSLNDTEHRKIYLLFLTYTVVFIKRSLKCLHTLTYAVQNLQNVSN